MPTQTHEVILSRPVHDTGSGWYTVASFLLPLLGLPAAYILRKHNYMRTFKACRKGALASFIFLGAILLFYGLLILVAII